MQQTFVTSLLARRWGGGGNKDKSNVVPAFNVLTIQASERIGERGETTTKLHGGQTLVTWWRSGPGQGSERVGTAPALQSRPGDEALHLEGRGEEVPRDPSPRKRLRRRKEEEPSAQAWSSEVCRSRRLQSWPQGSGPDTQRPRAEPFPEEAEQSVGAGRGASATQREGKPDRGGGGPSPRTAAPGVGEVPRVPTSRGPGARAVERRYWEDFHSCTVTALTDCQEGAKDLWDKLRKESKNLNIQGSLFELCGSGNGAAGSLLPALAVLLVALSAALATWLSF
ncbi:PREDICTED: uncharacterized protein LOC103584310 [Galeopterus variegatus]|uniref:Uncharacterized protein LOC103584310 n=1 Tax=Galeopterus variegatus TaxID=482537 RepID=A0ABM0Q5F1_GALVR|nr:PREDICTED: uncharacterized protein LOC103584310 [Galeopterus variegatus]